MATQVTVTTRPTTSSKAATADHPPSSPRTPVTPKERNQAPGIPDRRKSTRPGSTRGARGSRKSSGVLRGDSNQRLSVASMASEMRVKDGDDDDDKHEEFADAASTPRPASTEPDSNNDQRAAVNEEVEGGLGISGAEETSQSNAAQEASGHVSKNSDSSHLPTIEDSDESIIDQIEQNDGANSHPAHSRQTTLENVPDLPPPTSPPSISRDRSVSPGKGSRRQSPVRIMQPPPSTAERAHNLEARNIGSDRGPSPRDNLARKASSGFGAFLGRMGSIRKPAKSPPAPRQESRFSERRGTSTSMASTTDGNGLTASNHSPKPSLQDQFINLRRQEEFNVHDSNGQTGEGEQTRSERAQSDADSRSPTSPTREGRTSSVSGMKSPPLNPDLPPGTASGMSAGPAVESKEVNWDLWQKVVYEGPAAVAKTSGEDLNKAITSGIPHAIRGVVWQVLAESKNEELENVYRTLKARGTDAEQRPTPSRSESTTNMNGTAGENGVASDASSEHSDRSTTANSGIISPPTSVSAESTGPELRAKLLEEKQKREAAALQKLEKAIRRDMGSRTSYSKYTQAAGLQDGLFGICKAYALFDEGVGYAQGINFITMPLLFNLDQEEAFTLLVRLMSKYDLRSMFTPEMPGLHLRLYQFERLLEEYEPAVYCHLRRRNVGPQLYATQWFLTLFAYRFPLQLVLRIYDLILSEGLTAILKFGIVLMQRNREALLEMKDMGQLTNFLKEKLFDVYIDKSPSASSVLDAGFFGSVTGGSDKELYRADEMVQDACNIKISDQTLARYTVEWEESQRIERERETELETLRTNNIALTSRVKALEERVQQSDAEHVNMAQDLVKCKVENDTLHDENEGLKLQVTELQKMVDLQPAEVESKLKEEMDRIMQRNIEVQNENRAVKEELEELGSELVNVKMAHAHTQEEYEAIKQKWSSVQALLNDNKA